MSFIGKNGLFKGTLLASIAMFSSAYTLALDPAPIDMGPIDFIPTVKVGIENNSNIYYQEDDEQASTIFTLRPELLFKAQDRLNTYQAQVYFENGAYGDTGEGDDDYLDLGLIFDAHWELNAKNKIDLYFDYEKLHDARGTAYTAEDPFSNEEVDEYDSMKLGGVYEFGFGDNSLYFTIEPFIYDKSYTTNTGDRFNDLNENIGRGSEILDYKSNEIDITAFYKVLPKTTVFFEIDTANYNYTEDFPVYANDPLSTPAYRNTGFETLDSAETRFYIGAKWDATANTSGTAKIGQYSKDFDEENIEDIEGEFAWDIQVDYSPTDNDLIVARTGSYVRETEGSGAAIEVQDFKVSWNHTWSERFSSNAYFRSADEDHGQRANTALENRDESIDTLEVSVTYNFRRWMDVRFRYNTEDRSSNIDGLNYSRDIVALDFDFSL